MNPEKLTSWLHRDVPTHYRAKVGEEVHVALPRIPMTAATQMVSVALEVSGTPGVLMKRAARSGGEGRVGPATFVARAIKPGRGEVIVSARDAISGVHIAGVEPLRIVVEVES